MNDHYKILGETVEAIRTECEDRLKAMSDKLLAAEIEATMAKDQLSQARSAQTAAERVTTKLLTQFGLVSKVFDEAKELALQVEADRKVEEMMPRTMPPENKLDQRALVEGS